MKYGRLTVVGKRKSYYQSGKERYEFECICECGERVFKERSKVRAGITTSCGCAQKEMLDNKDIWQRTA